MSIAIVSAPAQRLLRNPRSISARPAAEPQSGRVAPLCPAGKAESEAATWGVYRRGRQRSQAARKDTAGSRAPGGGFATVSQAASATKAGRYVHLLAGALFGVYATVSVSRHLRMESTGYDLGIFTQAVAAYAQLRAPVSELKGFNVLGDHFHPVLALLAPAYRLFPGPQTLLIAQAGLVAASVPPVGRLATRRLRTVPGLAVTAAYGLSWGIQSAVNFDFHEICFALPLLACSLGAFAEHAWRRGALWAAPLVLVKEELTLTVAALGCYLLLRGQRRLGAALATYGVAAFGLVVGLVLPALNPHHAFTYWNAFAEPPGALSLGVTQRLSDGLTTKLGTCLMLLLPTAFLALRSPVLVVALPTLGWRFLSDSPAHWGTGFHYSAVLMPTVFFAFLDAIGTRPWAPRATAAAISLSLLVSTQYPLVAASTPGQRDHADRLAAARVLLALIPDGATVEADNRLAPQLVSRCRVRLAPATPSTAEYVLADLRRGAFPTSHAEYVAMIEAQRETHHLIAERDGFILLHHLPPR